MQVIFAFTYNLVTKEAAMSGNIGVAEAANLLQQLATLKAVQSATQQATQQATEAAILNWFFGKSEVTNKNG